MAEEAGLQELVDALRWRWKLVLLIAAPVFLGTLLYAESLPLEYQAKAIVSIAPATTEVSPSQVTVGGPKYVSFATAAQTIRRLAARLDMDPKELEDALEATLTTDTGDLTLTATDTSAERATDIANAFAGELVRFSASDGLLEASVTASAVVPLEPSGPPKRLMEASALMVGVVLGLIGAFLVERSRPRVRTWRDIAVLAGYPVVGKIPTARAIRSGSGQGFADPIVGAAARTLRTNLDRELGTVTEGVVGVTSAVAGEGKSAVAGLFATALARMDQRVLLIDADLHRAGMSRGLRVDREGGLAGVLQGRIPFERALQPGWTPGLTLLPTAIQPNPGELVALNLGAVLEQARARFDVVVLDTPPLLGVDDSSAMATMADGVLLVVSAGSMASPVSEAVLTLRSLRVRVWGAVANRLPRTGPGGAASYLYSYIEEARERQA